MGELPISLGDPRMKTNPMIYQLTNVIAVVAVLVMNSLVNILPLNGVTTAQVSDSYPNLFTPPGYVFSIWGVIYALAVVFMLYQARPSERSKAYLTQIGFLYTISAIANVSWLFVFQYSYRVPQLLVVSLVPMAVLLLSLFSMYQRLGIGRREVPRNEKLAVHLSISVYLGWISLAIIANIASVLNVLFPGIPIDVQALWTVVVLVLAATITVLMVWARGDFAFGLVVIWASVGIALYRVAIPIISLTSLATCALVAILVLVAPFLRRTGFINFYMNSDRQ
jgi:benzodiazapine receptor